jgi:hypothetical protein
VPVFLRDNKKMMTIEDIRENRQIMDCLNLEMTPEKAVALYLEWGSSWAHGRDFIRSQSDVMCYFTIDAWKTPAQIILMRQSIGETELVSEVEIPHELVQRELDSWGGNKGTYGISEELREWIREKLALS